MRLLVLFIFMITLIVSCGIDNSINKARDVSEDIINPGLYCMLRPYEEKAQKDEYREFYTEYFKLMRHRSHKDTLSFNWRADTIITCNGYSLTCYGTHKMFIISSEDTVYFTLFDSTPVSALLKSFDKECLNQLRLGNFTDIKNNYAPTPECHIRMGKTFLFSRMIIKDGTITRYDTLTIYDGWFTRRFWDKYELENHEKGTIL